MSRQRLWELLAFAAFALFALYAAAEPILAANDCISILEIVLLLPYYGLLYFGTLPAFVWLVVRRTPGSGPLIALLFALLLLEALAVVDSPVVALANRCIDFVPLFVLLLWWQARIWPCARALQGARR